MSNRHQTQAGHERDEHDDRDRRKDFPPDEDRERSDGGGDKNLEGILGETTDAADRAQGEKVTIGEIVDAFGPSAYGPLLVLPALITLIPFIGAIPGLTVTLAAWILLVAVQMLLFQGKIWLPKRLRGFSVTKKTLERGVAKVLPAVQWVDKIIGPRLTFLAHPPFTYGIAAVCAALALLMFPLALIPGAVGPAAVAVLILGLGLTIRDGILIILGLVFTAGAGWAIWYFFWEDLVALLTGWW